MEYQVYGPFEIPRTPRTGTISRSRVKQNFWKKVAVADTDLPSGCGCYVFALRSSRGTVPWYVGMTENRTFKAESLDYHKLDRYNDVLLNRKGRPLLFLIAKKTKLERFAKPSTTKQHDIRFLETYLIGHALNRNPNLANQHKTKFLKSMYVPGVLNPTQGRRSSSVAALCKALRL